jgi:hypothetical protein
MDEQLVVYIRDQSCIIHQIDTLRHFDKYESPDEMLAIWGNMTTVLKVSSHTHVYDRRDAAHSRTVHAHTSAIGQGVKRADGRVPRGRWLHVPQQVSASPRRPARAISGRAFSAPCACACGTPNTFVGIGSLAGVVAQVRLLDLVNSLVYVGHQRLQLPETPPPFNEDTMPVPTSDTSAAACIRNIDALLALQNYFIASKSDSLREKVRHVDQRLGLRLESLTHRTHVLLLPRAQVLQVVSSVFTKSKLNIWLIYAVDYIFLLRFVDELVEMNLHLQEQFINMIAYLAMENHFVPFKELQGYAPCLHSLFPISVSSRGR